MRFTFTAIEDTWDTWDTANIVSITLHVFHLEYKLHWSLKWFSLTVDNQAFKLLGVFFIVFWTKIPLLRGKTYEKAEILKSGLIFLIALFHRSWHLKSWSLFRFVQKNGYISRGVVPGGAGGAMAPPDFGRPVNSISTMGWGQIMPTK